MSKRACLIEQAEALGEPLEDPLIAVLGPLRLLGCELRGVQWRRDLCEIAAQFLTLAESKERRCPADDRASSHGAVLRCCTGEHRAKGGRISIRRSRFTILANIARWRRDLARTFGSRACPCERWRLVARLSRGRARRTRTVRSAMRAMNGQAVTLMYALYCTTLTHILLRRLRRREAQADESSRWRRKKERCSGRRWRMMIPRLRICALAAKPRTQFRRSPRQSAPSGRLGATCLSACRYCPIWRERMRISANSTTPGAASTKR